MKFIILFILFNISFPAFGTDIEWGNIKFAKEYQLQISRQDNFKTVFKEISTTKNKITIKSIQTGIWYWRVRAKAPDETFGKWSDVGRIEVFTKPTLDKPILEYPPLNQAVFAFGDSAEVNLTWSKVDRADSYSLVLKEKNKDKVILNEVIKENSKKVIIESKEQTEFEWKIQARGDENVKASEYSQSQFVVSHEPTTAPEIISPQRKEYKSDEFRKKLEFVIKPNGKGEVISEIQGKKLNKKLRIEKREKFSLKLPPDTYKFTTYRQYENQKNSAQSSLNFRVSKRKKYLPQNIGFGFGIDKSQLKEIDTSLSLAGSLSVIALYYRNAFFENWLVDSEVSSSKGSASFEGQTYSLEQFFINANINYHAYDYSYLGVGLEMVSGKYLSSNEVDVISTKSESDTIPYAQVKILSIDEINFSSSFFQGEIKYGPKLFNYSLKYFYPISRWGLSLTYSSTRREIASKFDVTSNIFLINANYSF